MCVCVCVWQAGRRKTFDDIVEEKPRTTLDEHETLTESRQAHCDWQEAAMRDLQAAVERMVWAGGGW